VDVYSVGGADKKFFSALAPLGTGGHDCAPVTIAIKAGGVTTVKLDANAVTNGKLGRDAVTTDKILNGDVGTLDLAGGAVTNGKLGGDAVTTDKIFNGDVGTWTSPAARSRTASSAGTPSPPTRSSTVTSARWTSAGGAVTNGKLGGDAVTTDKIFNGDVGTLDLADGAVTLGKLASGAVTEAILADKAATTAKLDDFAVTKDKLGAKAAETAKLTICRHEGQAEPRPSKPPSSTISPSRRRSSRFAVTSDQLGAKAVETAKLDDFAVTKEKLALLAVTKDQLAAKAVETGRRCCDHGEAALLLSPGPARRQGRRNGQARRCCSTTRSSRFAVTKDQLAAKAVETAKLDDSAVTEEKIKASTTEGDVLTTINGAVEWQRACGRERP
jgi:hypothetical protein